MIPLDSGQIRALGEITVANKIQKAGPRIGYMPQETALIGELSVKETIYYFGKIFQINDEKLRERYLMLRNLLELPRDDHRVEDCSGGQQRRVSFAAAMIHEPDLLILDEPTVGLDPILREKIWDFMLHITRTSRMAIIITTHYIEEAKQADRCGLMRNGILLAEDAPRVIIEKHQCENLEAAFLLLCVKRGVSEDARDSDNKTMMNGKAIANVVEMDHVDDNQNVSKMRAAENNNDESDQPPMMTFKRKKYAWTTLRALFTKNYIQMKRQPA